MASTPYSTIAKFFQGSAPEWAPEEDAQRIMAYKTYEDLYWGNPDAYKVVMRGTDGEDKPIYVPSGRQIIETLNRYVAKGFGFAVDPEAGSPQQQLLCIQSFQSLFDRERLLSKFASEKRFGLIRGDWGFHITADPNKAPGSRLTITALDPGSIFKVVDDDNVDRVIGYRIASQVTEGDDTFMLVTEYLKSEGRGEEPGGPITSETFKAKVDQWWDPEEREVVESVLPPTPLDPRITALPVYHIPNFEETGFLFGSSELRGLEVLSTAINQSVSDEDVALAMQGLGMYWTDSGSPINAETGDDEDWILGPGRVVEVGPGRKFDRVNGVGNVGPFQDHLAYLHEQLRTASGVPAVAMGHVEVSTAESGIALALKMGPLLSRADEKDLIIQDIMNHMMYDLRMWFQVYEQVDLTMCGVRAAFGEKLPMDRAARFKELLDLFNARVISGNYFRKALVETFGYEFPQNMANEIVEERKTMDPYAERMMAEGVDVDAWGGGDGAGAGSSVSSGAGEV